MNKDKKSNGVSWGALSLVTALTAAKLGWILYSKRYIDHNAKLNIILDAEQHTFDSHTAGKINFFVNPDGNRTPVLLVHGLHLYAGLHDMLPIFDSFRTVCPIYARKATDHTARACTLQPSATLSKVRSANLVTSFAWETPVNMFPWLRLTNRSYSNLSS